MFIKVYPKEKYKVIFNQDTGLFARIENNGCNEPFWAQTGPELLDISITNWCDFNCTFCYKESNKNGIHMSLADYEFIMNEARENNVFQVALGGGNPNQHPDFLEIIKLTRDTYNIVPSYTTNGRGMTREIVEATKMYCGAVAISAYEPNFDMLNSIKMLISNDIKTNIHFLLTSETVKNAVKWLEEIPEFLENINAIIFLNYKPTGMNKNKNLLLNQNKVYKKLFSLINSNKYPFKIGFDSCSVSGILSHLNTFNISSVEPCDAGRFSAYISEKLQMYPCSFMVGTENVESLKEKSLKDIWNNSTLFNKQRELLSGQKCRNCEYINECLNGCPLYPEINLCDVH